MKLIAFIGGLLLSVVCLAETVEVDLVHPTLLKSGAAIPTTGKYALASVRVEYGTCNGLGYGTTIGGVTVPFPGTVAKFTMDPGVYCYRARWMNNRGDLSAYTVFFPGAVPESGSITMIRQVP